MYTEEREREVFSNCSLGARWVDTPLLRSHQQVTYFTLCLKIRNCWCVWWAPSCAASSHAPTFKNHFVYKGGSWGCVRPTEKLLFRHESVSESDRKWGVCLFGKCCVCLSAVQWEEEQKVHTCCDNTSVYVKWSFKHHDFSNKKNKKRIIIKDILLDWNILEYNLVNILQLIIYRKIYIHNRLSSQCKGAAGYDVKSVCLLIGQQTSAYNVQSNWWLGSFF